MQVLGCSSTHQEEVDLPIVCSNPLERGPISRRGVVGRRGLAEGVKVDAHDGCPKGMCVRKQKMERALDMASH